MAKMIASASGRRLPNWITSFTRFTENLEAPAIFRKWAGISILAAVMERKVWNKTRIGILYPNLYVVLVGPPGAGKSNIISICEKLLRTIEDLHIAPSSVTSASLIDTIQLANRKILHPRFYQFNSLQVLSSELQNFLPSYEASFMGILTKLYDCELYEERRRTGKVNHIKIDHTQLNILAGTTPSYLNSLLPEGAWDQGFTSRTIFVFSEKHRNEAEMFEDDTEKQINEQLFTDLSFDIKEMMHIQGQMIWQIPTRQMLQAWMINGEKPVPEHGRLTHYNTRRTNHVIKLACISSMARSNDLQVYPEDFDTALAWLLEAEALMPDIFKQMSTTAESRSMEDARYYMKQMALKLKGPVPEHYLMSFLKDRIPSQNLAKVIEIMVKSRMLQMSYHSGITYYMPIDRT